jgi:hypothetical protein
VRLGGKGRMEGQWSSEWRVVAMNCKENEVVVCDGKGPCSGISICAVDAGSGHSPCSFQFRCPAALEQHRRWRYA